MALPRANLKRALAWRDAERLPWVPHERVWGPVSAADAIAVGCVRAAASVVIRPKLSPHALAAAVRCVPTEVLPRADESQKGVGRGRKPVGDLRHHDFL